MGVVSRIRGLGGFVGRCRFSLVFLAVGLIFFFAFFIFLFAGLFVIAAGRVI